MAAVFVIIGGWTLLDGAPPRWWALAVAAGFAVVALLKPGLLGGLNRLWIKFGLLLGRVVSPIVLGLLFYGVLTPISAIARLAGKDPLRLTFDAGARSYWIPRQPPGPPPDSMNNQF